MIMTLNVQESGRVKYIKRPGVILEAGCVVARLELDDPSKVHAVCGTLYVGRGPRCFGWPRRSHRVVLFRESRPEFLHSVRAASFADTLGSGDDGTCQLCPCLLHSLPSS